MCKFDIFSPAPPAIVIILVMDFLSVIWAVLFVECTWYEKQARFFPLKCTKFNYVPFSGANIDDVVNPVRYRGSCKFDAASFTDLRYRFARFKKRETKDFRWQTIERSPKGVPVRSFISNALQHNSCKRTENGTNTTPPSNKKNYESCLRM